MQFWDRIVECAVILSLLAAIIVAIVLFRRTRQYREIVCEMIPAVPLSAIWPRRWQVPVFAVLFLGLVYASLFTGWRKRDRHAGSR
jgi:uncharacterized membrane protein